MTRPTIDAILEDSPRAGETVRLNVGTRTNLRTSFCLQMSTSSAPGGPAGASVPSLGQVGRRAGANHWSC
jgi:hypothetical protein